MNYRTQGLFLFALLYAARVRGQLRPSWEALGLGAVTNFFDTLGIGSFAPTIGVAHAYSCSRRRP